ncbi:unnamed protein product [Cylicocyclus nassatus]|uniref:Peptidase C1A papain C-terminal domain-containing protein n=1 Tax=Cylicocyclus nassatus TaxID=53992 RepID=A0AA36GMG2_CYLNA|nr:unnamed protein product [Cylicocyclus nassatus]
MLCFLVRRWLFYRSIFRNHSWILYRCNGGYMLKAFQFALLSGVVTGGLYKSKDCCKPYPFHLCGQHKGQPYYGECLKDNEVAPPCRKQCQFRYEKDYSVDKIFADSAEFVNASELAIQTELFTNGPVQAGFIVYDDFRYYQKGVYVHTWFGEAGGHAVRIIGWGVENGVKYWLVSNSWNSDWGEEGLFKIRVEPTSARLEKWSGQSPCILNHRLVNNKLAIFLYKRADSRISIITLTQNS